MHSNSQEWMEFVTKLSIEETRVGLEACFAFVKLCEAANLNDGDIKKIIDFVATVVGKQLSQNKNEEGAAVTVRLFCSHTHAYRCDVRCFVSLFYVRMLTCMFNYQEKQSPIPLCDSSDMSDLSFFFRSPVKETKDMPTKRKYHTRSSDVAVTSKKATTVVPAAATPVRKRKKKATTVAPAAATPVRKRKKKTIDPAHWIAGRGVSGLKGVGYEPTTIKSRPWRAKFKSTQMRFATRAEAAEWFFSMNKSEKQK